MLVGREILRCPSASGLAALPEVISHQRVAHQCLSVSVEKTLMAYALPLSLFCDGFGILVHMRTRAEEKTPLAALWPWLHSFSGPVSPIYPYILSIRLSMAMVVADVQQPASHQIRALGKQGPIT